MCSVVPSILILYSATWKPFVETPEVMDAQSPRGFRILRNTTDVQTFYFVDFILRQTLRGSLAFHLCLYRQC